MACGRRLRRSVPARGLLCQFGELWAPTRGALTGPFVSITVKPRDADPNEEVLAAIARQDVTDAIVKVEVHIDRDQETLLRLSEARRALADAHTIASIRPILPEDIRSPLPPNVQPDASSPIETLDTFLKLRKVADERRERLLAAATEIIEESESVGV